MKQKYHELINLLEPFIVCSPNTLTRGEKSVLGKRIKPQMQFNPLSLESKKFIEKIYLMDQITFGEQGMGMEKWVFFDCAAMPGFVFGYSIRGGHLSADDRKLLGINRDEFFPVSMYIAIPTLEKNCWFGHNLSSLNGKIEKPLKGLGLLTKYASLRLFEIQSQMGATQWDSSALGLHLKLAELELLSAYTPIHSKENTLCYKAAGSLSESLLCEEESLETRSFNLVIEEPTEKELKKLQGRIEVGEKIYLVNLSRQGKKVKYYLRVEN